MDMLIDPPEVGAPLERWDAFIASLKVIEPRTPQLERAIAWAEEDREASIRVHKIRRLHEEAARDPYWGPTLDEARQQARKDHDWSRYDALWAEFEASRA